MDMLFLLVGLNSTVNIKIIKFSRMGSNPTVYFVLFFFFFYGIFCFVFYVYIFRKMNTSQQILSNELLMIIIRDRKSVV